MQNVEGEGAVLRSYPLTLLSSFLPLAHEASPQGRYSLEGLAKAAI